jgi:hypothetical protein
MLYSVEYSLGYTVANKLLSPAVPRVTLALSRVKDCRTRILHGQ